MTEPDLCPPPAADTEPDWDNLDASYVPTMSWNGEPFFGQDRFDQFFWRLRQDGLTKRHIAREPFVAQPLRWPSSSGGE